MKKALSIPAALPVFLVLGATLAAATWAQPTRPIYPVYEGYVPNDDGTAVLVFGYYNHNSVAVEIPAGEANRFDPGPADRGQPTVFEPGRQRNVCLIVLPADYEGNLSWSVTVGENTKQTTERGGIDTLYLIENISMAYRRAKQVDTAAAEQGVCLTPAPASTRSQP
ncbi:MAG: hypothetical protein F4060_04360 [Holophagales bacterium]|nr:hypothetical protein [Holophagales bacterium]MYG29736.1 hypothetical protein [Holophagales bacterium]MYI79150.1 hypothetical protein [Holophagales bacterium]